MFARSLPIVVSGSDFLSGIVIGFDNSHVFTDNFLIALERRLKHLLCFYAKFLLDRFFLNKFLVSRLA